MSHDGEPDQRGENTRQASGWQQRLLGFGLLGVVIFAASFWLFEQGYQRELNTVQTGNLTQVHVLAMNAYGAPSGETRYEIIFDSYGNTFRASTNQSTYQRLSLGQQTPLYFNESLRYVLLEREMTKFGIEVWIAFLLLFTLGVLLLFYGVGRIYKRFKKRGRPERPLSEL